MLHLLPTQSRLCASTTIPGPPTPLSATHCSHPHISSYSGAIQCHTDFTLVCPRWTSDMGWPSGGKTSSDSVSSCTSRNSGSHPLNLCSASLSVRYNPIHISSAAVRLWALFQASMMTPTTPTMTSHLPLSPRFKQGVSPMSIVKTTIHFLRIYSKSLQGNPSPAHQVGAKEIR